LFGKPQGGDRKKKKVVKTIQKGKRKLLGKEQKDVKGSNQEERCQGLSAKPVGPDDEGIRKGTFGGEKKLYGPKSNRNILGTGPHHTSSGWNEEKKGQFWGD